MSVLKIYGLTEEQIQILKKLAKSKCGEENVSRLGKELLLPLLNMSSDDNNELIPNAFYFSQDKKRTTLRLPEKDRQKLQDLADKNGESINTYCRKVLQSHVSKHAAINHGDSQALVQSNYQLLRIGRNLNQIAKQLNAGEEASLSTVHIGQLRQFIEKHTSTVHDVLRTNKRRFE